MTDIVAAPLAANLLAAIVDALRRGHEAVLTKHARVHYLAGDHDITITEIAVTADPDIADRVMMLFFKWFAETLLLNVHRGSKIKRLYLRLGKIDAVKNAFKLAVGRDRRPLKIEGRDGYYQWKVPDFPSAALAQALSRKSFDGIPTLITGTTATFSMKIMKCPLGTAVTLPSHVVEGIEGECKSWGNRKLLTGGTFSCILITDIRLAASATAINDVPELREIFWYLELYARTRFLPVVVSGNATQFLWNRKNDWRQGGPLPMPHFVGFANDSIAVWCPESNGVFWSNMADVEERAPDWATRDVIVIDSDESDSSDPMELSLSEDIVTGEKISLESVPAEEPTTRVTSLLLECLLTGYHPSPMVRMRKNLGMFSELYDVLRKNESASIATYTGSNSELQKKLEALLIVERHPVRAVYVRGRYFQRLAEFPLLGAVVEAYDVSALQQGGPCALLIRKAIVLAPPRFNLTEARMEEAFDTLHDVGRPVAGTTKKQSATIRTAAISLTGVVKSGRATLVTKKLMESLKAFDDFCMHLMHLIFECVARHALLGLKNGKVNALALKDALAHTFDDPKKLEAKRNVIAVFYEPGNVLEGHEDPTDVATFITTRTRNDAHIPLLNLADMDSDEPRYQLAYDRWDVVFFPAKVWHQTNPYPSKRDILNLFY